MACTLEKVLGDARTLLERLKDHDTAAEALIEQSGTLSNRVHGMREVGNALPDKVRTNNAHWCCPLITLTGRFGSFVRSHSGNNNTT